MSAVLRRCCGLAAGAPDARSTNQPAPPAHLQSDVLVGKKRPQEAKPQSASNIIQKANKKSKLQNEWQLQWCDHFFEKSTHVSFQVNDPKSACSVTLKSKHFHCKSWRLSSQMVRNSCHSRQGSQLLFGENSTHEAIASPRYLCRKGMFSNAFNWHAESLPESQKTWLSFYAVALNMVKYVQIAFCKWSTRDDWQTRRGNIKHWSASPRGRLDETVKFQGDAIDAWQTCKCYRRSSRSGQECANALRNWQPHGRLLTCFQQCVPMKQMICRLTELSTNHQRGVIIHASQIKTAVKVRCATKKVLMLLMQIRQGKMSHTHKMITEYCWMFPEVL